MKFDELKQLVNEAADTEAGDEGTVLPPLGNVDAESKFKPDAEVPFPKDAGAANRDNLDERKPKDAAKDKDGRKDKKGESRIPIADKEVRMTRDKLIDKFNKENGDATYVKLVAFEEDEKTRNAAFKVVLTLDPEEIYLDKGKYKEGDAKIQLNKIFYKDIESLAKELGADGIEWKQDDDETIGIVKVGDDDEKEDDGKEDDGKEDDGKEDEEDEDVDGDEDDEVEESEVSAEEKTEEE